jgi:Rad3-related DNA helicase
VTKQKIQNDEFEESIKFWCLKPSVAFKFFKECHSVILCSGTLSPMSAFRYELDFEFKHEYIANHVINNEQVCLLYSLL